MFVAFADTLQSYVSPEWGFKYFCGKNLSIEEFLHEFQRFSSWLSTSLDLQIPSNLELILGNWNIWNQIWYV